MVKQIQKSEINTGATAIALPLPYSNAVTERLGALLLTALAMLVSLEMIIQHNPWTATHYNYGVGGSSLSELFARGEGRGEAARLPEEFDIGLQTPHITGI